MEDSEPSATADVHFLPWPDRSILSWIFEIFSAASAIGRISSQMRDCSAIRNGRMGNFINPSATADRNFSNSSATVEFHFFHWSDCSHLGDFSELVAALLNREGNTTLSLHLLGPKRPIVATMAL